MLAGTLALAGCSSIPPTVSVPGATAYSVVKLDASHWGLVAVDPSTATAGYTATLPDLGAKPVSSWPISTAGGQATLAISCDDNQTRFVQVTDGGHSLAVLPIADDTGLAASSGNALVWLQPLQDKPAHLVAVDQRSGQQTGNADLDTVPTAMQAVPGGFLLAGTPDGNPGGRTTLEMLDPNLKVIWQTNADLGTVLTLGWNAGPQVVVADSKGDRQMRAGDTTISVFGVGSSAQQASLNGPAMIWRDADGTTVRLGSVKTTTKFSEPSSPLGLTVTPEGAWAVQYADAVGFGKIGDQTTRGYALPGTAIGQW